MKRLIIPIIAVAALIALGIWAYNKFFKKKGGKTLKVPAEPEILKRGTSGARVMELQKYLQRLGANFKPNEIDGIFGPQTEQKLKSILNVTEISWETFQKVRNLTTKALLTF
jgi:peptidoglycan hydrolase-like protein with peptidoglycan-binding domain